MKDIVNIEKYVIDNFHNMNWYLTNYDDYLR